MPTDWFEVVSGRDLEQGDIIPDCPVYSAVFPLSVNEPVTEINERLYDVVVLSQSCDLVLEREKLSDVVLCPLFTRSVIENDSTHALARKGMLLNAAKN